MSSVGRYALGQKKKEDKKERKRNIQTITSSKYRREMRDYAFFKRLIHCLVMLNERMAIISSYGDFHGCSNHSFEKPVYGNIILTGNYVDFPYMNAIFLKWNSSEYQKFYEL